MRQEKIPPRAVVEFEDNLRSVKAIYAVGDTAEEVNESKRS